ncbi:MAG: hypothetical protein HYX97_03135 [Chloroflexi bacterium]|nr:hypothetical protein [Chloroflexota bacterium]
MLKGLGAVLLGILFFVLFVAYLSIYTTRNSITDADFYKDNLREADIYEKAYTEIFPAVIKPGETNKALTFYGGLEESVTLTDADIAGLARQLFPKDFVQSTSERFIDEIMAYARKDKDSLDLVLDLRERKAQAPAILTSFLGTKYDQIPNCTGGLAQEQQELLKLTGPQPQIPSCFPSQAATAALRLSPQSLRPACRLPDARAAFRCEFLATVQPEITRAVASAAPDRVDLVDEAAKNDGKTKQEFLSDLDQGRNALRFTRGWGLVIIVVLLVLSLVALWALYRTRAQRAFIWIGGVIFVSGLLPLIAALISKGQVNSTISDNVDIDTRIDPIVIDLSRSMVNDFFQPLVIQTAIVTALGLVILVVALLLYRSKPEQPAPPAETA